MRCERLTWGSSAFTAAGTFWIRAFLCVCTVWFVWKFTPETKAGNLEEIEQPWIT
jgi:succinate-acetate transporter protein